MSQIFVSYSRQDKDFVLRLVNDLRANHVAAWLDQKDIAPGQRWDMAIEQALDAATHIIFVMSKASTQSQNVRDELDIAMDSGKTILPILLEDCTPPLRTRRLQYTDFRTDYDAALKHLLNTLDEDNTIEAFSVTSLKTSNPAATQPKQVPPIVAPVIPTPAPIPMSTPSRASRTPLLIGAGVAVLILLVVGVVLLSRPANTSRDNATDMPSSTTKASVAVAIVPSAKTEPLYTQVSPLVSTTVPPSANLPVPTSTPACPKSLPSRLKVGERGRAAFRLTTKLDLRSQASYSHDTRSLGLLFAGDTFTVSNGPNCDSSGVAWWNVTMDTDKARSWHGESGWLVEANTALGSYYVDPLDNSAGSMRSNLSGWPAFDAHWKDDPGHGLYAQLDGGDASVFMSHDSDGGADFDYSCRLTLDQAGSDGGAGVAMVVRGDTNPTLSGYRVALNYKPGRQNIAVQKLAGSKALDIPLNGVTSVNLGQQYELKITSSGPTLNVYVNGVLIAQINDTTGTSVLSGGRFGLAILDGAAHFRDCSVYFHHN